MTNQTIKQPAKLGFFGSIQRAILISLLTISGVDYDKLRTAPKSERVVYPALGVLMCLAALWTGFGLTMKMYTGLNLQIPATVAAFIFTTVFALLLEMVVVGTLKTGTKILGNLGVRILLGINLMLLQVVPVLVIVFQPTIDVYKNEQVLQKTVQAREIASKSQDISGLAKMNESAEERYLRAKANRINPPENRNLTILTKDLDEKLVLLDETTKKYETSKYAVNVLKSNLAAIKNDKDRQAEVAKINRNLRTSEAKMSEAKILMDNLQIETDDLKVKKQTMITEYDNYLNKELSESTANLSAKNVAMKKAMEVVEQTTQNTEKLAQSASTSRFFNDVSSLIEIMNKNNSILYTSLFVVFIALLIDLMPILTKLQLSKGVYAKIVNDDEEIIKALTDMKKVKILSDIEKQKVDVERQKVALEQERLQLQQMQSQITVKKLQTENNLKTALKQNKPESGFSNFVSKILNRN